MTTPAQHQPSSSWLSRIKTRQQARSMLREASYAMFFLAAVEAAFAFKYGPVLVLIALLLAFGTFCVLRWQSRTAALFLLALAAGVAIVTLANNAGANLGGGKNIAFALILFWTAIKACEACFRLNGKFALSDAPAGESTKS